MTKFKLAALFLPGNATVHEVLPVFIQIHW